MSRKRYLTIRELKDNFFSLKINNSTGANEITFNAIKNCFGESSDILRYVFDLSLQAGIFSNLPKIPKIIPVFKTGDLKDISNYRPIPVPPCFLKNIRAYYAQPVM